MEKSESKLVLHQEHREMLNVLNFMQDEIKYFQNRLAEVVALNTGAEVQSKSKEYKSYFLEHLAEIDEYRHSVYLQEHYLAYFAKNRLNEGRVIEPEHKAIKSRFEDFQEGFKEMKHNFTLFLADVF